MTGSPYLQFEPQERPEGRKTDIYDVVSTSSGEILGEIRWFGRWRQYCFNPSSHTIFNPGCLGEIAEFADGLTVAHRSARATAKATA